MYNYIDEVPEEIQEQADAYFNHEDVSHERETQFSNNLDKLNQNNYEEEY